MLKQILIFPLLLSFVIGSVYAADLSYSKKDSFSSFFKKSEARLSDDLYLNINLVSALTLVDDRFEKENRLHESRIEQPLLTLSYKF